MPQRKGSASSLRTTIARRSALLLVLVVAGLLGTAQLAAAAPAQPDIAYLNAAHQSNLTIIQAAEQAKTKGRTSCVRQVGALLERDHRKIAAQELSAASKLGFGLVPIPSLAQRQKLDALTAKVGTSGYDAAWLALQKQEHLSLLALTKTELAKGSDASVKSVAQATQTMVQMHLQMVGGSTCQTLTGTPKVHTGDGGQMADGQKLRLRMVMVLLVLGVLLLVVGKPPARRRLLGVSALILGILLLYAGPPGDSGKVPEAGPSLASKEGALPPVRLKLPGYLDAPVVPVATGSDGQLQVPASSARVGWWAAGAAPGSANGTVLLAGHVDSASRGRGVFAVLWNVPVGAKVAVKGGDGGDHEYRIVARRIYSQEALPSDLFRGATKPRLALVTCIGSYDHVHHRYTHNLVLYGVPTD